MDRIRIRIQNKSFRIHNIGFGFELCACTVLFSRIFFVIREEKAPLFTPYGKSANGTWLPNVQSHLRQTVSIILRNEPRKQELRNISYLI
jgi:hypothetical protein